MGYCDWNAINCDLLRSRMGWNLSSDERDAMAGAIAIVHHFPMRERFWLNRLAHHKQSEVTFILGDGHIESFTNLLNTNATSSRVVERCIGITEGDEEVDKYRMERALEYLEKHPEIWEQEFSPRPPHMPDRP